MSSIKSWSRSGHSVIGSIKKKSILSVIVWLWVMSGSDRVAVADPLLEARGIWVTRWDYQSAQELDSIIEKAARAGFNQIYFQVRAAADAYYQSSLVPWAARLTGRLGKDPKWDPLACALSAARRMKIELHAWVNLATGWTGDRLPPKSRPKHILRSYPHWRVVSRGRGDLRQAGGYMFVSLANPELQAHLLAVIQEIVSKYDVDGLHLDYARYPSSHTSYDRVSNRLYRIAKKEDPSMDRAAWQRNRLAHFIKNISEHAKRVRPGIEVSAAVCGIYKNRWDWSGVVEGSVDFFQDSHLWAKMGSVDVLIPMMYWKPTQPPGKKADFFTLAEDFKNLSGQVKLLAGINVEAGDFSVLEQEVEISRELGYQGVVLFAYRGLAQREWLDTLSAGVFKSPALPRDWLGERLHWDRISTQFRDVWQKWVGWVPYESILWGVFNGLSHAGKTLFD